MFGDDLLNPNFNCEYFKFWTNLLRNIVSLSSQDWRKLLHSIKEASSLLILLTLFSQSHTILWSLTSTADRSVQISTVNTSSSAELPKDILLRQVMLNLLFHEIFILILFPYRSGGWKKVCLDGSYIAKCQMTNTSFSVLMFQENLWRSGKCYLNYLIFGA